MKQDEEGAAREKTTQIRKTSAHLPSQYKMRNNIFHDDCIVCRFFS
jgi:formate hydrogenlyase subunit 6/NADH:ubiquinone oxidoreductase subunit I